MFLQHYKQMLLLARMLLHDEEESRDAVSEVFARFMESGDMPPDGQEKTYLLACVRNNCLNIIRHKSIQERVGEMLSEDFDTDITHEMEKYHDILQFAREHLPALTFQVLTLRYLDGMKYQELADSIGISEATVYRHLAQALHIIKEQFNKNN